MATGRFDPRFDITIVFKKRIKNIAKHRRNYTQYMTVFGILHLNRLFPVRTTAKQKLLPGLEKQ